MRPNTNGINMLDVKIKNRSSILNLIYQSNGISRKDIAAALGLTPAAITVITTDLIKEGILYESTTDDSSARKGRKETLLKINTKKYAAVGVFITRHKFRMLCIDLDSNVLFEETIYTADCHKDYRLILEKLLDTLNTNLLRYDVLRTRTFIGLGISTNGIVDTNAGISISSYGIWDHNVPVVSFLKKKLDIPILLTNNICALAHGEYFLSQIGYPDDMLFIKYGPGVGAARLICENSLNISGFQAIELGHIISIPNGAPCVCNNAGCLETIASYDSIESAIKNVMSAETTPHLYEAINQIPENITMKHVANAYMAKDPAVCVALNRAIYYLTIAIRNAICMFNPKKVVLYGELFENPSIALELQSQLSHYTDTNKVKFSHFNLQLDVLGPATTIVQNFFQNGGKL